MTQQLSLKCITKRYYPFIYRYKQYTYMVSVSLTYKTITIYNLRDLKLIPIKNVRNTLDQEFISIYALGYIDEPIAVCIAKKNTIAFLSLRTFKFTKIKTHKDFKFNSMMNAPCFNEFAKIANNHLYINSDEKLIVVDRKFNTYHFYKENFHNFFQSDTRRCGQSKGKQFIIKDWNFNKISQIYKVKGKDVSISDGCFTDKYVILLSSDYKLYLFDRETKKTLHILKTNTKYFVQAILYENQLYCYSHQFQRKVYKLSFDGKFKIVDKTDIKDDHDFCSIRWDDFNKLYEYCIFNFGKEIIIKIF